MSKVWSIWSLEIASQNISPNVFLIRIRESWNPFDELNNDHGGENAKKQNYCAIEDQLDGEMNKLRQNLFTLEEELLGKMCSSITTCSLSESK